jgi:vancomycin permeability regulator SanA
MSKLRHKYIATRPFSTTPTPRLGPRRWAYHRPVRSRSTLLVILRRAMLVIVLAAVAGVLAMVTYKLAVDIQTQDQIYAPDDPNIPENHVALVLGAGLNRQGRPSAMLYDRIAAAVDLYKSGKVDKLLMSGDNGDLDYNEVEPMRRTAIDLGVDPQDIVLDYAGFNTWDSCYRARDIFSLAQVTIVTQRFHLPRAIHTCSRLGVEAIGVVADRQPYRTGGNELREYIAMAGTAARFLINDKPRFLGPRIEIDNPEQ